MSRAGKPVCEISAGPRSRLGGTSFAVGKEGHLEACKARPDQESDAATITQWCLPSRRQQAGSFEPGSEADSDGLISERLKITNSSVADRRRTKHSVLLGCGSCKVGIRRWWSEPSQRAQVLSYVVFVKWFDWRHHSMVFDVAEAPLRRKS